MSYILGVNSAHSLKTIVLWSHGPMIKNDDLANGKFSSHQAHDYKHDNQIHESEILVVSHH